MYPNKLPFLKYFPFIFLHSTAILFYMVFWKHFRLPDIIKDYWQLFPLPAEEMHKGV